MTKTGNTVAVAVLTVFILGFANFMQQGSFIVPFPFISEFLFMMIVGILILRYKPWTRVNSLLVAFGIFSVFAGRFLWETILDFEQLVHVFEKTILIDIFKIVQFAALILLMIEIIRSLKSQLFKIFHGIFILGLIATLFINGNHFLFGWYIGYGTLCFLSLRFKKDEELETDFALELFIGLGLIYLMSAISIGMN